MPPQPRSCYTLDSYWYQYKPYTPSGSPPRSCNKTIFQLSPTSESMLCRSLTRGRAQVARLLSSSSAPVLLVENDGAYATLTLNRPEVHNALNEELVTAMKDTFAELRKQESLRAVRTGPGVEKSWSAEHTRGFLWWDGSTSGGVRVLPCHTVPGPLHRCLRSMCASRLCPTRRQ